MKSKVSSKNLDIILTSLMIAIIFIAANIIKIPTIGGYVHMGDCMVFLSAVILNKKRATLASAIGMSLVDIFSGYIIWAPFTFLIKGLMAYIAASIIEKLKNKTIRTYLISFTVSGVFMIVAYFFAGAIIARILIGQVNNFISAIIYSAKDILGNIFQVVLGILIAVPLSKVLVLAKKRIFEK
ncbi:ECF transporter S component [Clostridium tarantellae]|uniref:ECF transporter S component n=1 Tax=Clostridium tarantellae TaxID=39493 RepID=A0A6I1MP15_9CLOT|nr:ECF transporter S component [Clostridium tarantellae]MPQ44680.1 ECF transporter S component [Clostridium tarantellae]